MFPGVRTQQTTTGRVQPEADGGVRGEHAAEHGIQTAGGHQDPAGDTAGQSGGRC